MVHWEYMTITSSKNRIRIQDSSQTAHVIAAHVYVLCKHIYIKEFKYSHAHCTPKGDHCVDSMAWAAKSSQSWKGRNSGKGSGQKSAKNAYAPAPAPKGYSPAKSGGKSAGGREGYIHAVAERETYTHSFLRAYPDAQLNCVLDFGLGPARLTPEHMAGYLNSNNCELMRRPAFGVSMVAASVRGLEKLIRTMPDGLNDIVAEEDKTSIFRALLDVKAVFEDACGQGFIAACSRLDASAGTVLDATVLRQDLRTLFEFTAHAPEFAAATRRLLQHGATLLLCSGWQLQLKTCVEHLEQWAAGFPGSADVMAKYPGALRSWLKSPRSVAALIEGTAQCYENRAAEQQRRSGGNNWDSDISDVGNANDSQNAEDWGTASWQCEDSAWDTEWSAADDAASPWGEKTRGRGPDSAAETPAGKRPRTGKGSPWAHTGARVSEKGLGKTKKKGPSAPLTPVAKLPEETLGLSLSDEESDDAEVAADEEPEMDTSYETMMKGEGEALVTAMQNAEAFLGVKGKAMAVSELNEHINKIPMPLIHLHKLEIVKDTLAQMQKMPKQNKLIPILHRLKELGHAVVHFHGGEPAAPGAKAQK